MNASRLDHLSRFHEGRGDRFIETKMTAFDIGWKRCVLALAACLAGGALQAASAAPRDESKLALLSCVPKTDPVSGMVDAAEWLNQTGTELPNYAGMHIAGPIDLGKACLKNVTVSGSFGAMLIQGEICNQRLDEFTNALGAIGIVVGKSTSAQAPDVVLSGAINKGQYMITKGMTDMATGKTIPTTSTYAFMCGAAVGGPQ
jgi:hypothetical protein